MISWLWLLPKIGNKTRLAHSHNTAAKLLREGPRATATCPSSTSVWLALTWAFLSFPELCKRPSLHGWAFCSSRFFSNSDQEMPKDLCSSFHCSKHFVASTLQGISFLGFNRPLQETLASLISTLVCGSSLSRWALGHRPDRPRWFSESVLQRGADQWASWAPRCAIAQEFLQHRVGHSRPPLKAWVPRNVSGVLSSLKLRCCNLRHLRELRAVLKDAHLGHWQHDWLDFRESLQ